MLPEDILNDFIQEAKGLLKELLEVVEKLEGRHPAFPAELLSLFAQRIDRIFGAAKTIGLTDPENPSLNAIGSIAEICKKIGYKAAERNDTRLLPFFAAFWADAIENIDTLLNYINNTEKTNNVTQQISKTLQGRLEWLEEKLH